MTTTEGETTSAAESSGSGRPGQEAAGAFVASLFAAHGRMVLGLCRLLLRDPVEAEDAAQQTFLSAHRSIDSNGFPREPAAWLAAIARNECRARIRLRMREPLWLPELPDDLPDPLARAIRNADLDALWAALAELPRRQRRAFLLRELGGLSYGELGAALGASRSAVESLLFRARQQLRALLMGTQAVVVPVTMRDRLGELIPSFDPASAGAIGRVAALPVAAKLATATVGAGLIAAGAAEVATQSAQRPRLDPRAPRGVHVVRRSPLPEAKAAVVAPPAPAPTHTSGRVEDPSERGQEESAEPQDAPEREDVSPPEAGEQDQPDAGESGGGGGESLDSEGD